MRNRPQLPSEQATQDEAARKERAEKAQEAQERIARAMAVTFSSPDGLIVLDWIRKQCGHNEPILAATAGQIDANATLYQAMRLNLYLAIRKHLPKETLMEVEIT